ncbi:hypothetical protein JVU11DRAFT_10561 [Chiua virens]|nr:hypothetical protein JVU11DRAFT_10561 [Chiua virens]
MNENTSLSTFQPLLVFPNVESFKFDAMCNIFFDDDTMKTVVTIRWPKLMAFCLDTSSGWGTESRITHRGLITLLRCPSLREFELSVNFAEIDLPQDQRPETRLTPSERVLQPLRAC